MRVWRSWSLRMSGDSSIFSCGCLALNLSIMRENGGFAGISR